jgi:uncharacterized protein YndB with AHSA1/START domain
MTRDRSFKRLVRARMDKTGESYTAARAALLAEEPSPGAPAPGPALVTSDAEIRRRTGRGWEQWFDLLDDWHADEMTHTEVARRVAGELGIEPLVWEAQAVTLSYERARGLRAVGQRADGSYAVTASKTVAVPVKELYASLAQPARRGRWLPGDRLTERTATEPTSIRFDWAGGPTRVTAFFEDKGPAKSTVTIEHGRLSGPDEAARMKDFWRRHLSGLKAQLEAG